MLQTLLLLPEGNRVSSYINRKANGTYFLPAYISLSGTRNMTHSAAWTVEWGFLTCPGRGGEGSQCSLAMSTTERE